MWSRQMLSSGVAWSSAGIGWCQWPNRSSSSVVPPSDRNARAAAYQVTRSSEMGIIPKRPPGPHVSPAKVCQSDPRGWMVVPRHPTHRQSWSERSPNKSARMRERWPSAPITARARTDEPSSKVTTTVLLLDGWTLTHRRPVFTTPSGSDRSRSTWSSPRCTPMVGSPKHAANSAAV